MSAQARSSPCLAPKLVERARRSLEEALAGESRRTIIAVPSQRDHPVPPPHDQPNLWHLREIFFIIGIPLEDCVEFTWDASRDSDPGEARGERMTLCRPV